MVLPNEFYAASSQGIIHPRCSCCCCQKYPPIMKNQFEIFDPHNPVGRGLITLGRSELGQLIIENRRGSQAACTHAG